jgi:hypothetical protein
VDSLCSECTDTFRSIAAGLRAVATALEDVPRGELDGEFAVLIALEEPRYVC